MQARAPQWSSRRLDSQRHTADPPVATVGSVPPAWPVCCRMMMARQTIHACCCCTQTSVPSGRKRGYGMARGCTAGQRWHEYKPYGHVTAHVNPGEPLANKVHSLHFHAHSSVSYLVCIDGWFPTSYLTYSLPRIYQQEGYHVTHAGRQCSDTSPGSGAVQTQMFTFASRLVPTSVWGARRTVNP